MATKFFGCMKVAMKVGWGLAHNSEGKSSRQQHPYFFPSTNVFVCGNHFVIVGQKKELGVLIMM